MNRVMPFSVAGMLLIGTLGLPAGCESAGRTTGHEMVSQVSAYPIQCQLCYDEAISLTRASPDGTQSKGTQTIRKHMCPGCNAEVTAYTLDRKPMIQCPGCVPGGVLCDRCLPPETARPAEVAPESWYEVGGD